ncbi:hypothetical protein [Hyalangium rubrum]|uniref:Uncharacterized protein n=1 Tax=Hyalangium rubrum TaxID=3103134 RepID=A0ABU5HAG7_9BACT|nr:hypothetical protein [Hyalangium sp. s54d21]MDY7230478.1 hypothetical protein [Hyalangium sp. s54d21]
MAPPFDYSLYCDPQGKLVGERSAVLLVYRSSHLERVYADAQLGTARALTLFAQLEHTVQSSGEVLANRASGLVCHSLPACTVKWHFLEELMPSRGPGGMRLRQLMADSFSRQARLQNVKNAVIAGALTVLLSTTVVKASAAGAAEAEAGAAEAGATATEAAQLARQVSLDPRLVLPRGEARLAVEEVSALEARLPEALKAAARHPPQVEVLARLRPSLEHPPVGMSANAPRWIRYVEYWERRYEHLASHSGRTELKSPLTWESYSTLLGRFQRALEFQRSTTQALQQEALASGQRQWLRGMERPIVAENVGLAHEGTSTLSYVDQLVVDQASLRPGMRPSLHTFSNKQHHFSAVNERDAIKQVRLDISEAQTKYGGTVEVRRPGHPLFGRKVVVSRVHLVYDGTGISPAFMETLSVEARTRGVSLHFHVP